MAQTVLLKRSSVAGNVPGSSDLSLGEIAVNTADGAVYIKKGNNDIVAVADNDILHIDTTNSRVGIGTSSPTGKIHVISGSTPSIAQLIIGYNNTSINYFDANTHIFRNGSSQEKARITSAGNLGIGTNNPGEPLHIKNSDAKIKLEDSDGTNQVGTIFQAGAMLAFQSRNDTANGTIKFQGYNGTTGQEFARFNASGNFGIGTTSPNQKLEIKTTSGTAGFRIHSDTTSAPRTEIEFMRGTTDTFGGDAYTDWKIGHTGSNQADFAIVSSDTTRGTNERVTIEYDTGNVGIGTDSPSALLHLQSTGDTIARVTSADGNTALLDLGDVSDPDGGRIFYDSGSNLGFTTASTERARIDSSGRLGIGTTSPQNNLHVNAGTGGGVTLEANANVDIDFRYRSGGVNKYNVAYDASAGSLIWYDNTANATRMTLDSSGNFGIGTNSPAAKFDIYHGAANRLLFTTTGTDNFITSVNGANSAYAGVLLNGSVVKLGTGGTERARIDSSGNFGIGTSSPATTLEVVGDLTLPSNGQIKFKGTNHYPRIYTASNDLKINLDNGSGSNYEAFRIENTTGAITFNNAFTFPTADGSANQVLQTDGSGNLSFGTAAGGGVSISNNVNNRVLTGDGTNANAEANLTFDGSILAVTGKLRVSNDTNDAVVIGSGNESITFGGWDSGQSDISGLLAGSNFGSLITGGSNGHVVVGIRDNDINDSFSVISGAGDYTTGTTYDKLAFQVNTDGLTTVGNRLDVKSQIDTLQRWYKTSTLIGTAIQKNNEFGIGNADSGILFNNSSNAIYPWNVGTNAGSDNLLDLGISSRRWKDLHLGGNINVGGTVDGRDIATDGTKLDGIEANATADQTQSEINALGITATGLSGTPNITVGTISSGAISTSANLDMNANSIIDVEQIDGTGGSGWLDFNMDTDSIYPQSTTDNQTVLGSVTHMNFVGDSNGNGAGGIFYWGYGVSSTDGGTFTQTMSLNRSGNLTATGAIQGTSFSDGTISGITFIDEDSFATNSATRVPTQQSIKAYVDAQVAGVVDTAPSALNTLNELAAALGDDANFSTTTSTALGNRLRVDTASQGLTGTQQANAITNLGITATKAELNYVDGVTSNIQTQLDTKLTSSSTAVTNKLPLAGGTMTGNINLNGNNLNNVNLLQFQNREITNFTGARQMIIDANDSDGNVPSHGDYAGSAPFGIYFTGDNDASTTTLGSGLVKVWHTGHFTKTHIDYFVGLYNTGVTTTEFDYLDGVTSNIQTQLNGKLSTSGTASHANNLNATDDRDVAPEDLSYSNDFNVYFADKGGLETGTIGTNYQDVLVLNTWSDGSGGDANALAFDKSEKKIYHYQADQAATNWGTAKTLAYIDDNITGTSAGLSGTPNISVGTINTSGNITAGNDINISGNELTFTNDAASAYIRGADALLIQSDYNTGENKPIYLQPSATTELTVATGQSTFVGNVDVGSGLDVTGNITVTGTVDGVDIAARNAVLTSTTTTANAALPKTGGTMTGDITLGSSTSIKLPNSSSEGIHTSTDHRVIDSLDSTLRIGDTGKHNIIRLHGQGSDDFRVYYSATDYQIFHAGNSSQFTSALNTKLSGIATNADVTPSWVPSSDPGYLTSSSNLNASNLSSGTIPSARFPDNIFDSYRRDTIDSATEDFDNYTTTGTYHVNNWSESGDVVQNGPTGSYGWGILRVTNWQSTSGGGNGYVLQEYFPHQYDTCWTRIQWNNSWVGWRESWGSGSDGSGSGLDADTVDGIQGGSFLRSDANDDFSGTLNYTPDTGDVINFDGQSVFRRMTTNGGLAIGHDDALILTAGEASTPLRSSSNVAPATETIFMGAEGGVVMYAFPNNDVTWSNRKTFSFDGANGLNMNSVFTVDINGNLSATTKSFDIEHPSKEGMRLRYGSLEGPENGVYVRGKSKEKVISLPEYWPDLIHEDSITVQLTAIGGGQNLYVEDIKDNKVYVNGENYFYYIQAERKDVERFEVEYEV